MTLIPIYCLACFIYSCWSCIKYGNIDFIEIILTIGNLCVFIIFTWLNCSDFFKESLKKYSKIEKLLCNIFIYSGLVCAIYLFLVGFINIFNFYIKNHAYLIYGVISLVTVSALLYIFKRKASLYFTGKSLIFYRITLVCSITISSLLFSSLCINAYILDSSTYNLLSLEFSLLAIWIIYLAFHHNFAYINYKRSKYLLFLRNFSMDEEINELQLLYNIEEICNINRMFLMRVGNPKKIFDYSVGKTLYLRSENWQDLVEQHIIKSQVVFAVISFSDGLFWEIINHAKYSSKFIYHIIDIFKTKNDISNGLYKKIAHTKFGGILQFICFAYNGPFVYNEESKAFSISFTFNDNQIIISDSISSIIDYIIINKDNHYKQNHLNYIRLGMDDKTGSTCIYYNNAKYLINDTDSGI